MFGYGSPLVCNARAALIHRPTFPAAFAERVRLLHLPLEQGLQRPSMWISYAPVDEIVVRKHVVFGQHHMLIGPQPGWEGLKVGGGAPPVRLRDRWLVLYHGVSGPSGAEAARRAGRFRWRPTAHAHPSIVPGRRSADPAPPRR